MADDPNNLLFFSTGFVYDTKNHKYHFASDL